MSKYARAWWRNFAAGCFRLIPALVIIGVVVAAGGWSALRLLLPPLP